MTMEMALLVSSNGNNSVVEGMPLVEAYAADSTFPRWLSVAAALENFGRWITFMVVTLHLFLQTYLLDFCGFPVALLLLTVTVPHILVTSLRNNILGAIISVVIGSYLLDRHIRYRGTLQDFTEKHFWISILAIILLLGCPLLEVYHLINGVRQISYYG